MLIRLANNKDIKLFYDWATDEAVRKNAFNQSHFSFENHANWFEDSIRSTNTIMYVFEIEGVPIGQARLNISESKMILDYSLDKNFRNKGLSHKLVKELLLKLKENYSGYTIQALVKKNNLPSIKVFKKLDFYESIQQNCIKYVKTI